MSIDRGPVTICDYIDANALMMSDAVAVQSAERSVTWRMLHERTNAVAHYLMENGLSRGDRLALLLDSNLPFVELTLAALKVGISLVPLSPLLTEEMLVRLVGDAQIAAMVVGQAYAPLGQRLKDTRSIPGSLSIVDRGEFEGFTSLDAIYHDSHVSDLNVWPAPKDEFNIIYSSGTTGTPKGIVHTHEARLYNALGYAYRYNITRYSTMLLTTSPATNGTWVNMLPTLLAGGRLILHSKSVVRRTLESLASSQVTHAFLVPTQVRALMDHPDIEAFDLSRLRCVIVGGSKFGVALKQRIMERLPGRLHEIYGTTECGSTALFPADLPDKIESVGRPIYGTEFRVIDEAGEELPHGAAGELVVRGVAMMKGYLNRPEADAEITWRDHRSRVFVRTGDIGRIDADGFVYILDRRRDMIITGGVNVFASDLEEVLRGHEAVADVAVIAAPHDKWGETPVAVVIPAAGTMTNADDILAWANARLGKYQRISAVLFREAPFPRNHLEKVLKRQLRDEYAEQFTGAVANASAAGTPPDLG